MSRKVCAFLAALGLSLTVTGPTRIGEFKDASEPLIVPDSRYRLTMTDQGVMLGLRQAPAAPHADSNAGADAPAALPALLRLGVAPL
jgi:hypothetical protein